MTAGPSGPVYTSIDVNGTETWEDRFILFGGPINVRGTLTVTNGFDNGADNSGPYGQNQALIVYDSGKLNADGAILNNSFDSNRTLLNALPGSTVIFKNTMINTGSDTIGSPLIWIQSGAAAEMSGMDLSAYPDMDNGVFFRVGGTTSDAYQNGGTLRLSGNITGFMTLRVISRSGESS